MVHHQPTLLSKVIILLVCCGSECHLYYVKTTPSESCPAKPCLTLSQFATHVLSSTLYPNTTVTVIFQRRNHDLLSVLRVDNITTIQLQKSSKLQSTEISCKNFSKVELNNITNIHLKGLDFIGCGGNRIELSQQLVIEDSIFLGQGNISSALELIKSTE